MVRLPIAVVASATDTAETGSGMLAVSRTADTNSATIVPLKTSSGMSLKPATSDPGPVTLTV